MNLDSSTRSPNVIDYRGVPLAEQPLSAPERAQAFAEMRDQQIFRFKILAVAVGLYVLWRVWK